jgi:DNA-directed RNA polymerase subunit M/transcription elongation factor TFIIS
MKKQPKTHIPKNGVRELIWDIENSAYIGDFWSLYDVTPHHIREYPKILTLAWCWYDPDKPIGKQKVYVVGQDDFKGWKPGVNDDTEIVKFGWELLNACHSAVAHNGDGHDVPIMNARIALLGLPTPEPYIQVDTKKMYKQIGQFGSNRLKDLSKRFGVSQKGDPGGYPTWLGVVAGDKKSIRLMKHYNKLDIPGLLELYILGRARAKTNKVPLNVLLNRPDACPRCGQEGTMIKGMKYRATNTNLYQYYRCNQCGGTAKSRVAEYKQSEERMKYV